MRLSLIVMIKIATTVALVAAASASSAEGSLAQQFEEFVKVNNKPYANDAVEYARRFNIFLENIAIINELNINNPETAFGVTPVADMTQEERSNSLLQGFNMVLPEGFDGANVGSSSDSNIKAGVVDYKHCYPEGARNQAQCGSCWAFATAASVQGAVCKSSGKPSAVLSPQHLVDCDKNQAGCKGASTLTEPFEFVATNGICTEGVYSYTGQDNTCNTCDVKTTISGYKDVSGMGAEEIAKALDEHGPLSVGVDASLSIQFYLGGVLNNLACFGQKNVNHAVTLVGYKKEEGKDIVFEIMNSWGAKYGKAGHFFIKHGACGFGSIAVGAVGAVGPTVTDDVLRV